MSGGSYNYLCGKDVDNIHESREELGQMRDRLIELGFIDAAKETEGLILMMDAFRVRMEVRIERLSAVWKSVEWLDSNDSGIKEVENAIEEYRSSL